ncbi:MAG: hypothetical protein FWC51_00150 [Proteobacteria bacterium]|nr:hypothetical protein [Pseudomonadota bacterium]
MKKSKPVGKIIIPGGALPETHELETANFFAAAGSEIEFLPPSYVKGVFSPDILMDGQRWEIKSPCGNSKRTIENNYRSAERQSENIVFDLRRIGLNENVAIKYVKQQFNLRRGKVKRVIIITKENKILDFKR